MTVQPKYRLMTPGPTPVPAEVLEVLSRPVTYHRSPESRAVLAEVIQGLQEVFQTRNTVLVLTSSGTGAMEAAVVNTLRPGAKALVLEAGRFAQRWTSICQAMGVEVVKLEAPWGQPIPPAAVYDRLREHPDVEVVFATLCETSTGVAHDIDMISRFVARSGTGALLAVDGISGVGGMECRSDAWGIDLLVTGSQKALMLPPGLAFISVSQRAWEKIERSAARAFYFDLRRYRDKLDLPETPFTPAHTLIAALAASLRQIRATGVEAMWRRTELLSRACQAGVRAMGLELFAARPAPVVTSVRVPANVDGVQLLRRLRERFNVVPAGGQGELKGKIVRIAHMGSIDELDVLAALAALEMVLAELGHVVQPGAAVGAAQQVLMQRAS